jgi:ubiquinone/menaquinone biosynthesis C-methylase UbiE
LAEFTGERVIPGEVDADLWNEHVARYWFAARFVRGRRVLDLGCGSGYGADVLAREAREVLGIDIADDAIDYARQHYRVPNVRFERASCLDIPAPDGSFELVVAFEIIEHLTDWRAFLREVRRVLAPAAQFLVSTPNQLYYAEARAALGPNPFHVHEFEYSEFQHELEAVFPRVTLYLENHTDAVVFAKPAFEGAAESRIEEGGANPQEAHFFLAVCSDSGETAVPAFTYVPRAANMLRERERHIDVLEAHLRERMARVVELQEELVREQTTARARIDQLETEVAEALPTAIRLGGELADKVHELAQAVEYLHAAERTVEERTQWAQRNAAEADELKCRLQALWATPWVRLGFKMGVLPKPDAGK